MCAEMITEDLKIARKNAFLKHNENKFSSINNIDV